jgi:hypothetical protein
MEIVRWGDGEIGDREITRWSDAEREGRYLGVIGTEKTSLPEEILV